MKEEKAVKLFQGVTGIGDDLIEEAGVAQSRKRISPWRWGAIAACLCLALAGTAVAARIFGVQIRHTASGEIQLSGGIAYYPYDSLSDEFKELADEPCTKRFDSWQELEDFAGVDLMNNPVLDASPPRNFYTSWDGVKGRCLLRAGAEQRYIHAVGCFEIGDVDIEMYCFLFTDRMAEDWDEMFYGVQYPAGSVLNHEGYTAANGLEAQIMEVSWPGLNGDSCAASVSLNGIPTVIYAMADDMEAARTALCRILDGFDL